MKSVIIMQKLIMALVAVLFVVSSLPASAQQAGTKPSWMPTPPKANGGKCDADPQWMRKWHMKALQHKRDQTMRQGIRTEKFSLKRCVTCHAVKDESGKFLTVKDGRHFCRACHDYAAVRIDCFDCHASRPGEKMSKAVKDKGNPHRNVAGKPASPKNHMDTTVAVLQKFIAGEGK
jgi:predicted CXXCH cytochrome family protein